MNRIAAGLGALCLALLLFSDSASAQAPADEPNAVDAERYPQIGFSLLDEPERRRFVTLSEEKDCPCPGESRNLSTCLAEVSLRCPLAERVASLMMRRIKEDADPTAIRRDVSALVTEALRPFPFDLENAPRRGPVDADVRIVVFSDFECPYCRLFSHTAEQLFEELGDRVAFYFMNFPLPQHPNALAAARAGIAAAQQGRFWEMHDLLFANQERLQSTGEPDALLAGLAEQLGLDLEQFSRDYRDEELAARPLRDREQGLEAGVDATPTVFINGVKVMGDLGLPAIRDQVLRLLQ